MPDDDELAVESLVRHLYGFPYPLTTTTSSPSHHIHVYAIGEKYGQSLLKEQAKTAFQASLSGLSPPINILAKLIELVYTTTIHSDRGLRDVVLELVSSQKVTLTADADKEEDMRQLFHQCPDFAYELYAQKSELRVADPPGKQSYYECRNCLKLVRVTKKPRYCGYCGLEGYMFILKTPS